MGGGVDKNSLNSIFQQYDINKEDTNEPDIMSNSSYYDIDDFIKLTMNYSEQFSIFSSSVESINAKFNELQVLISLLNKKIKFSAICLQECWLSDNFDKLLLHINGYHCIFQRNTCSAKGGLVIYLSDNFEYDIKLNMTLLIYLKAFFIEVKGGELKKTFYHWQCI